MKNRFLFLLFFCLFSCATSRKSDIPTCEDRDSASPVIIMDKRSGYGKVPSFRIVIRSNGLAELEGRKNLDKIGNFRMVLDPEILQSLINAFQDAGFYEMADDYTGRVRDKPVILISFSCSGRTKTIRDITDSPPQLKELEARVENLIHLDGWEPFENEII